MKKLGSVGSIAQMLPGMGNVGVGVGNMQQQAWALQAHAAAALINFCDMCAPEVIEPYLEALLSKLFARLREGVRAVQEQAITAVASLADCSEHLFGRFYDTFMPALKGVLAQGRPTKADRVFYGKALECISLIGTAVGKAKFMPDALEVMHGMVGMQMAKLALDDPQRAYIVQTWSRIGKCLHSYDLGARDKWF